MWRGEGLDVASVVDPQWTLKERTINNLRWRPPPTSRLARLARFFFTLQRSHSADHTRVCAGKLLEQRIDVALKSLRYLILEGRLVESVAFLGNEPLLNQDPPELPWDEAVPTLAVFDLPDDAMFGLLL